MSAEHDRQLEVPRPEHPRPDFRRANWTNLNGPWAFAFDDDGRGLEERWHDVDAGALGSDAAPFDHTIRVPFAPQSPASGVGDTGQHDVSWYARVLPPIDLDSNERLVLHVGACDHEATVWVNGDRVAHHEGGYTPFVADITTAATGADDVCVIRVHDAMVDLDKPRGKQYWKEEPAGVFYTGLTGIWQTVWLEVVHVAAVEDVWIRPRLEHAAIDIDVHVTAAAIGHRLRLEVRLEDGVLAHDEIRLMGPRVQRRVRISEDETSRDQGMIVHDGVARWSPWDPVLHDLTIEVVDDDGTTLDRVDTYFGMRSVEVRDGRVLLNGLPLYQRLVLDQGYFPDGGYTARTDAELRRDIELAKELGFIGCRKHQKIEDPRWLYWADRLGFIVWAELPSAHRHSTTSVQRTTATWHEAIVRDRNHPCIIVWVPINESWGAPSVASHTTPEQVHYVQALYHLTKTLDPTRLVVSNDGWEQADTDLCTIHEYGDASVLAHRLTSRQRALDPGRPRRASFAAGHSDRGAPIVVSEFGGISLDDDGGWGFHTIADGDGLAEACTTFVRAVTSSPVPVGFCWTQLTDIEQETNGLLTIDRTPKAPIARLRAAITQSEHSHQTDLPPSPPTEAP